MSPVWTHRPWRWTFLTQKTHCREGTGEIIRVRHDLGSPSGLADGYLGPSWQQQRGEGRTCRSCRPYFHRSGTCPRRTVKQTGKHTGENTSQVRKQVKISIIFRTKEVHASNVQIQFSVRKKISCVWGSPTEPTFLCRSYNFFFNLTKKFYKKKGNFCATCCKKQIENPSITARVIVV